MGRKKRREGRGKETIGREKEEEMEGRQQSRRESRGKLPRTA